MALVLLKAKLSASKWFLIFFVATITCMSYFNIPKGNGHIFSYSALLAGIIIYKDSTSALIRQCFSYTSYDLLLWMSGLTLILINFTWRETSDLGRYASFSGEPNNDAVYFFTQIVLTSFFINNNKIKQIFLVLMLLSLVVITGSRMLVLMVLSYYFLSRFSNYKTFINFSGVVIFISSFATQFVIAGYLSYIELLPNSGNSIGLIDRVVNINDDSNIQRIASFIYAFNDYTSSLENILWGSHQYKADNLPDNVIFVHQWVLGMLINFGLVYTIMFSCFFIYLVFSINRKFKPVLYSLILGAGILHQFVLLAPVMFVLLISFVDSNSHINLKMNLIEKSIFNRKLLFEFKKYR
ncbi:hypothetical protein [uncultured Paraglaciecola sp.]|uniref:hypothetical protein n=1 Tax=uncultured Paraglaciecola sp. TaxID=1765024 RepID=UPI0025DEC7D6|nr:hypothetical protein [uncultured Paraglaciecola sp.]